MHTHSYHIATGGGDHIVNIWDIRKGDKIYTIPAHTNLVSHVKFQGTLVVRQSLYVGSTAPLCWTICDFDINTTVLSENENAQRVLNSLLFLSSALVYSS